MAADKEKIIDHFIHDVSLGGEMPKSVFSFCKAHKLKEADFYEHFSNFKALEKAVWNDLFTAVAQIVENDEVFNEYNARERYLAYCFTLVEQLKKNLTFYRISANTNDLKEMLNSPGIKALRKSKSFFQNLVEFGIDNDQIKSPDILSGQLPKIFQMHVGFVIKYFLNDESEGFSQTDQAIEKSVKLLFDALENSLLGSVIDFSKFMGKSVLA
ncbi:hypothetical protein GC194_04015 [bacterium]|nr:hypothetical protein [bacterium]